MNVTARVLPLDPELLVMLGACLLLIWLAVVVIRTEPAAPVTVGTPAFCPAYPWGWPDRWVC
jgi:hypothetical protein